MYDLINKQCDESLKAGRGQEAATILNKINISEVPRQWRLPLARLCRRAGTITTGLKLLTTIVRPKAREGSSDATPSEWAEYAALLNLNGAVAEAEQILAELPVKQAPETDLFIAFCHFGQWEYEAAVPHLRRYISVQSDFYARLVGQVNLASALLGSMAYEEAEQLLEELIGLASEKKLLRLAVNSREMFSQMLIRRGDLALAEVELKKLLIQLESDSTSDLFFVRKWLAIAESLSKGDDGALQEFRLSALQRGDWESLREADLYLQKLRHNEEEFNHLYFGTPYLAYRQRIELETGRRPSTDFFIFGLQKNRCLRLCTGEWDLGSLKPAKAAHHTLRALTRDLYRPMSIGGMFAEIYPGEHFNVFHSPMRLHQVLRRARKEFAMAKLPLQIVENSGRYVLKKDITLSIELPLDTSPIEWSAVLLQRLVSRLGPGSDFVPRQACQLLKISSQSFQRLATWALGKGLLARYGSGAATGYRLL